MSESITTRSRYSAVAIALHWAMALVLLAQLPLGLWMVEVPKDAPGVRAGWFNLHKSLGLVLLLLIAVRLAWRLLRQPPAWPSFMPHWQQRAAAIHHGLMYAAMVVVPLSGLIGSMTSGYPIRFFGWLTPVPVTKWPAVKEAMSQVHGFGAWLLLALILMHLAATAWHAVRGEPIGRRMGWTRAQHPLASGLSRSNDEKMDDDVMGPQRDAAAVVADGERELAAARLRAQRRLGHVERDRHAH